MARNKSVLAEREDIHRAVELIELGARLQVLESETKLSRERLLRLYKEVQGKSPSKGMLPFSTEWFMTWQPNVHASLFMGIYRFLDKTTELHEIDAIIRAYRLYIEQINAHGMPAVLSVTRAWRLVKFFDAGMLTTTPCTRCQGHFVVHTHELTRDYVCGLCDMPSRAGHTKARAEERLAA
jgi:flagellar transcriptional activator FlhC